jgi:hypothetical protein
MVFLSEQSETNILNFQRAIRRALQMYGFDDMAVGIAFSPGIFLGFVSSFGVNSLDHG